MIPVQNLFLAIKAFTILWSVVRAVSKLINCKYKTFLSSLFFSCKHCYTFSRHRNTEKETKHFVIQLVQ